MRALIASMVLIIATELYGQDILENIQESSTVEVYGTSEPMPNHGVERHMMAVYKALYQYVSKIDSVKSGTFYEISSDGSASTLVESNELQCDVDYEVLQNFVDTFGAEHVLLRVRSGSHRFNYISHRRVTAPDSSYFFRREYFFSAFNYPLIVHKNQESTYYEIGSFKERIMIL